MACRRSSEIKEPFSIILNSYWEPLEFELPAAEQQSKIAWRRWIDTALDSPHEIEEWQAAPLIPSRTYCSGPNWLRRC